MSDLSNRFSKEYEPDSPTTTEPEPKTTIFPTKEDVEGHDSAYRVGKPKRIVIRARITHD